MLWLSWTTVILSTSPLLPLPGSARVPLAVLFYPVPSFLQLHTCCFPTRRPKVPWTPALCCQVLWELLCQCGMSLYTGYHLICTVGRGCKERCRSMLRPPASRTGVFTICTLSQVAGPHIPRRLRVAVLTGRDRGHCPGFSGNTWCWFCAAYGWVRRGCRTCYSPHRASVWK